MTGRLAIVGLGPGAPELMTPLAAETLAAATDLVGYAPYLARVPERAGQRRHASDNREELARARQALDLALTGRSRGGRLLRRSRCLRHGERNVRGDRDR